MKVRDYLPDTGSDHRPGNRQPAHLGAVATEDLLLDHHIEEVLSELHAVRAAKMAVPGTADS
jgi:hypothetical protein